MTPDVFGEDIKFINNEPAASNDTGRFAPYWAKEASGKVIFEALTNSEIINTELDDLGIPDNEWFACSIRTKQACTLNPYLDTVGSEELLMTSITVPLIEDSKVIGTIGIDLSLASLQPLIMSTDQDFVDGHGEIILVSQDGVVAGHDQIPPSTPVINSGVG